ncbi:hypothetical protein LCM00_23335 [Bacillus infantis]|uniref:hypothetical protein n=1 Tax=Bacillus infantis TaxID=324767 RepID=UPI001CD7C280|nr:hypothetical protein [Bacillus infantis]MCA1042429.1 hypothetical protein [Bacillus infantis]
MSDSKCIMPSLPTVVTICWFRNLLNPSSPKRISQATVLGNDADDCQDKLETGDLFSPAADCLLDNGFQLVTKMDFGFSGFSVFTKKPKKHC